MTTTIPAPAGSDAPADPTDELHRAADKLGQLPPTRLTTALTRLLHAVAGDMYGCGAYELPASPATRHQTDDPPLVCGPAGPQPTWTAALALARAVCATADGGPR